MLVISIKLINTIFFYSVLKKLPQKQIKRNIKLFIVVYSIQKFPRAQAKNLQHLHFTTEKDLTSNHCLKLKSVGFSVLKYVVLTFC